MSVNWKTEGRIPTWLQGKQRHVIYNQRLEIKRDNETEWI